VFPLPTAEPETPSPRSISPILPTRELTAAEKANKHTEGR